MGKTVELDYSRRRCLERGASALLDIPFLLDETFFLAIASCSAIWVSKCLSLFCSISRFCRSSRIAFLGASFLFCAPPLPPNQDPHILTTVLCLSVLRDQTVYQKTLPRASPEVCDLIVHFVAGETL